MLAEVLIKIGDSVPGEIALETNWLDGQPVVVKPYGFSITPAEMYQWIYNEITPANLSLFKPNRRERIEKTVARVRDLNVSGATFEEIALRLYPSSTIGAKELSEARDLCMSSEAIMGTFLTYGIDSNWGYGDLKSFGVVIVDIDVDDMSDITTPPLKSVDPVFVSDESWARRRYKVPYSTLLSIETVALLSDKEIYVPVPRGGVGVTPFTHGEAFLDQKGVPATPLTGRL